MTYEVRKAEKELDEFLNANPQLVPMQKTIERALEKSGNDSSSRFRILSFFITENLKELRIELKMLQILLERHYVK